MPTYRFGDKLLHNKTEICNGVAADSSSSFMNAPDDTSVPLPLGALAFSDSHGLLPTHITARGRVDPGGLATVWVAHTFRVPAAAPASAHYFLPRRAMRRPPPYRAGVLYPPRAAVEHRGGAYRNGTNCDIFTKPPHKDWIFEGALPSAWPAPWFCSEVTGIVRHTKGGAPRVVSSVKGNRRRSRPTAAGFRPTTTSLEKRGSRRGRRLRPSMTPSSSPRRTSTRRRPPRSSARPWEGYFATW